MHQKHVRKNRNRLIFLFRKNTTAIDGRLSNLQSVQINKYRKFFFLIRRVKPLLKVYFLPAKFRFHFFQCQCTLTEFFLSLQMNSHALVLIVVTTILVEFTLPTQGNTCTFGCDEVWQACFSQCSDIDSCTLCTDSAETCRDSCSKKRELTSTLHDLKPWYVARELWASE